jgi:hypothetical protein
MSRASRLRPEGPHYIASPGRRWPSVWWRDPYLFQPGHDDTWHALLCAAGPDDGPDHTGAVLAHVRTRDFESWEHLPPIDGPTGRFYHTEVPEHFTLDGRHYILFSTGSCAGIRLNVAGRRETCGTYYMAADQWEGPYHLPQQPLLVGSGSTRLASYVARTIEFEGHRLLYHHVRDDSPEWTGTWAAPKRLDVEPDGSLAVRYWPGLSRLETRPLVEQDAVALSHGVAGATHVLAEDATDVHLHARVKYHGEGRCGAVLRATEGRGLMVSLDFELGQVEIGVVAWHDTFGWGADLTNFLGAPRHDRTTRAVLDTCRRHMEEDQPYVLRCLVRGEHLEVYVDDRWVFTTHVPDAPRRGRVELFAERGTGRFEAVRLHELEAWSTSSPVGETHVPGPEAR